MESEKGRQLHQQALDAQENGDYLAALKLEDEAMMAYQADNDNAGFAEIQSMRLLTLNMIGDRTGDKRYYILALYTALASLELAEQSDKKQQIALAHGAAARALERLEKFAEAAKHFDSAIEILTKTEGGHNRKSVLADFKGHAAVNKMLSGQLDQEAVALAAIKELEAAGDASDYELKVWKCGALMRLAYAEYKIGRKEDAKRYITEAESIAKSDEALKIRREEIKRLREKFGI